MTDDGTDDPQHASTPAAEVPPTPNGDRVPVGLDKYQKRRIAWEAAGVVGVDAGKFHHALVVRPRGGRDSKPLRFPTTREGFETATAFIHRVVLGATPREIVVGVEFAGVYGYTLAHYLDARGYRVVSVLPSHTKSFKQIEHGAPLKTDEKDAVSIVELAAEGRFTTFAFLRPEYAGLRYLVSGYERVTKQSNAAVTRLRSTLHVAFPEFETVFRSLTKQLGALAILREYPSAAALLAAPKRRVVRVLETATQRKMGVETYEALTSAAAATLAVPDASDALAVEVRRLVEQIDLYTQQRRDMETAMTAGLATLPEAAALLSVPGVSAVTAAVFLGSIGDPRAYESGRQVLKLAGLQLVKDASGTREGRYRISRFGKGVLRRHAFLFAMRSVKGSPLGIYHRTYQRFLRRDKPKMVALIAIARQAIRLWYVIARSRQPFDRVRFAGLGAADRIDEAVWPSGPGEDADAALDAPAPIGS